MGDPMLNSNSNPNPSHSARRKTQASSSSSEESPISTPLTCNDFNPPPRLTHRICTLGYRIGCNRRYPLKNGATRGAKPMKRTVPILALILVTLPLASGCTRGCAPGDPESQAILNADKNFSFPPGFPSDPGEKGKQAIAGIDADNDGVRDDVQRWIYARYPTDEKKRKALTQFARSSLFSLRGDLNQEQLSAWVDITTKAIACMTAVLVKELHPI